MTTFFKIEVYRGYKRIAQFLDMSVDNLIKHREEYPLIKEGGRWTLTNLEYQRWRDKIYKTKEK